MAIKKISFIFSAAIFILATVLYSQVIWAALVGTSNNAVLSLSPSSGTYQAGQNFTVDVLVNTRSQNVVVVSAIINFSSTYFEAVSIDTSQSAFNLETEKSYTSGQIKITRGKATTGVNSASAKLASVTFRAKTAIAPTFDNINFSFTSAGASGDSDVILDNGVCPADGGVCSGATDILSGVDNGRYTITAAPIVPPPADNNPPVVSNVSVYPDGSLLRAQGDFKVYIINSAGYKRHIFNPAVFNMYGHLKWENVIEVSKEVLDSYKTSDLYRADIDFRVYSLEEINEAQGIAVKHHINMIAQQYEAKGYSWSQIFIVNQIERDYYQTGTDLIY